MSGITRRALLGTALAAPALAQAGWPNRPIRFISPFAPGGSQEVPARIIAEHLSQRLGQPVVIESKPGAGSAVGTQFVARELFEKSGVRVREVNMGPSSSASPRNAA